MDTVILHSNQGKRRQYDSTRRQAQAQDTRQAVLDAGRALIIERGYARTTMRDIATRAGVAVETVYKHARSKPALLRALLDADLGGPQPTSIAQRAWVSRVLAHPDAVTKLAAAAAEISRVYATLAPLFLAARAAADADDDAAEIWTARKTERLAGMTQFAQHLIDTGQLHPELTLDKARDLLFAYTSPELYGLFVLELGWPPQHYTRWLTDLLHQQLLNPNF